MDFVEATVSQILEREPGVVAVWLFGSRGRGTPRTDSDADVAVLFDKSPPPTLEGLQLGLQERLAAAARVDVDLVIANRAPPDLMHRVLRDGRLLVDRDRSARIRFEVRVRNEYFDLRPHLDRYRRLGA